MSASSRTRLAAAISALSDERDFLESLRHGGQSAVLEQALLEGRLDVLERTLAELREGICSRCVRSLVRPHPSGLCGVCHQTEAYERRAAYIERRWREGALVREIADELGMEFRAFNALVYKLRKAGRDIPYRRRQQETG